MEDPIGSLEHPATGRIVELRARHLVGRAPGADLRLPLPHVSAHHAELLWSEAGWFLRDLGSRNGTFVADRRVAPGEMAALAAGARLDFGLPQGGWRLRSAAPPQPMARLVGGDQVVLAREGRLEIPGRGGAVASPAAEGWRLARGGESWAVEDGEIVRVGGQDWLLCLPRPATPTAPAPAEAPAAVRLHFAVSLDEEHVQITIAWGDRRADLPARAHLYTLLVLARQRLADEADPALTEAERGWIDQAELCRMLGIDANLLYTHLHRFRKQLLGVGVDPELIERRLDSGQLRLGTPFLTVERS